MLLEFDLLEDLCLIFFRFFSLFGLFNFLDFLTQLFVFLSFLSRLLLVFYHFSGLLFSLNRIHGFVFFVKFLQSLLNQPFTLERRRFYNSRINYTIWLILLELCGEVVFLQQLLILVFFSDSTFKPNLRLQVHLILKSFLDCSLLLLKFHLLVDLIVFLEHLSLHGALNLQNPFIFTVKVVKLRNLGFWITHIFRTMRINGLILFISHFFVILIYSCNFLR